MYIKWNDFTGILKDGNTLLLSGAEFAEHKAEIKGLPICVTADGSEPRAQVEELLDAENPNK